MTTFGGRTVPPLFEGIGSGLVTPFADTPSGYFAENFAITKAGMVQGIGIKFPSAGIIQDFATSAQVSKWFITAPVANIGFNRNVRIQSIVENGLLLANANGSIAAAGVGVYVDINALNPFIVWPNTSPIGNAIVIFEIEQFNDTIVRSRFQVIFTQNA